MANYYYATATTAQLLMLLPLWHNYYYATATTAQLLLCYCHYGTTITEVHMGVKAG